MIFRPSGGLRYHWRAWRDRALWQPFVREIAAWLSEWRPGGELLVIGPSAGYTLPSEWLLQFREIHAYDLDPLASLLWRHRPLLFHRVNVFWNKGRLSFVELDRILNAHPGASLLFSNVLGQVLLEGEASESEWQKYLLDLRQRLANREWASYHDRFTYEGGEVIDHLTGGEWSADLPKRLFVWQLSRESRHEIEGVIHRR
jgi:hypothetical protein